jgi:hypothetical protein
MRILGNVLNRLQYFLFISVVRPLCFNNTIIGQLMKFIVYFQYLILGTDVNIRKTEGEFTVEYTYVMQKMSVPH